MDQLPSTDELFPAQSVDELFPADVQRDRYRRETLGTSPIQDLIMGDTSVNPVARVLDAFRQGASHAWGANDAIRLSKESEDFLKVSKQFDAWKESQSGIAKAANEALFRPAATQLVQEVHDAEALYRGVGAIIKGGQAAVSQVGQEMTGGAIDTGLKALHLGGTEQLGHDVAGAVEAFPAGVRQPTGIPHAPPHPMLAEIERARDMGVIGAGEEGWKGTAEVPAPTVKEQAAIARPEVMESAKPEVSGEAPRPSAEPVAVDAAPAPVAEAPIAAPAEAVQRVVDETHPIAQDVSGRLVKAGRPAEEASAAGQVVASHYEARAARFEGALGTADELYAREGAQIKPGKGVEPSAVESAPEPKPVEGGAAEAAPIDLEQSGASEPKKIPSQSSLNETASWVIRNKDTKEVVMETFDRKKVDALNTAKYEAVPIGEYLGEINGRPRTAAEDGQSPIPSRVGLGDNIHRGAQQDWTPGRIVKVGFVDGLKVEGTVPAEFPGDAPGFILTKGKNVYRITPHRGMDKLDAASGKLALEDARAAAKAELELDQIKRGHIRLKNGDVKPIITLLKDQNASTFIHETGHQWLEELMRDSQHPKAPERLLSDSKAVLDWFGVEKAADIKTRHHEQFARGFERYMMEGKAPTQGLAKVFAAFKNWLTRIYQTVDRLKSPINDEIRGVFDRLVALKPEQVKIEPEAPKTFADIHEADALHTAPEAAHPVAETVQAERDRLANEQLPGRNDARLADIEAEASRREAGGPQPVRDGNEAGVLGEGTGDNPASGAVGEGGSNVAPESARPSAQPRTEAPVSSQETFKTESPLVDKAGNIRLENVNTTEDVKQVIRDSAERNNGFIEARRGVVTDADAIKLSEALGLRVEDLAMRKIGEAWNKEQIFALEKLLIEASTAVRDAMASGNEVAYAESVARFRMIQETVQSHASGVRAEAGRALQAFAALKNMAGRDSAIQLGEFLKENTGKTLFQLQREMQLGMKLDTPADVAKFVTEANKPKWHEKLLELWISFLLSGPKTQVANALGNAITNISHLAETSIAAGYGKVLRTKDGVLPGEVKAELFGMIQGAKEGVVAARKAFETEEPQLTSATQNERGHQKSMGSWKVNILGREMEVGGKQARLPLRLMGATDEFFKAVSFRSDIYRQALAKADKEGLPPEQMHVRAADLAANPTDEMIATAKKFADYQTFQTPLGNVGRAIQNVSNAHPLIKVIVPFVRTPINLLKYAGERTPLGVFSREVRDNLSGKNGGAARDTQLARITLGTMVGVAALEMASSGVLTGGGPADAKERAVMKANGWQEYSVKIGDMYYSYKRLDPFSTLLGVVADGYEISHAMNAKDAEKHNIPALLMGSITKTLLDKASLKGASDLIQAATQWERFGDGYIRNMAGTVVPAFSAQTAQAIDPVVRETRTVLDNLKARIPFVSETLHAKRDIWGEPMMREGGLGPDIASPIAESRLKNDPVNQALLSAGYFPGKLSRKIRGVELTDQQYDDYQRVAGRTAKTYLNAMIDVIGNPNIPADRRREIITSRIRDAREKAETLVMMESTHSDNNVWMKALDAKRANLH